MKTKYPILVFVAACVLALNSFADGQRPAENHSVAIKVKAHGAPGMELTIESTSETVRIKAHSETIAELKVAGNGAVIIRGAIQTSDSRNQLRLIPVNDGLITVQINCSGGIPITLQADEVELHPGLALSVGPEIAGCNVLHAPHG